MTVGSGRARRHPPGGARHGGARTMRLAAASSWRA